MNFKFHWSAGLIGGAAAFALGLFLDAPGAYNLALAGGVVVGSQFPDLDTGSIPARWFGRIGGGTSLFLIIAGKIWEISLFWLIAALIGLVSLLTQGSKHRGLTHKYWIPLGLCLLSFLPYGTDWLPSLQEYLLPAMLRGFALGVVIHLLLDGIFPWQLGKAWFVKLNPL